ncbi:MAG: hypothetical protein ACLQGT_05200 [Terracidiphilus sp.]
MRISVKAMAFALGLLWGGGVAFAALAHLAFPSYGIGFLEFVSSIYPGFHGARNFGDAMLGTVYGLFDGAIGGLIFAWLYNLLAAPAAAPSQQA